MAAQRPDPLQGRIDRFDRRLPGQPAAGVAGYGCGRIHQRRACGGRGGRAAPLAGVDPLRQQHGLHRVGWLSGRQGSQGAAVHFQAHDLSARLTGQSSRLPTLRRQHQRAALGNRRHSMTDDGQQDDQADCRGAQSKLAQVEIDLHTMQSNSRPRDYLWIIRYQLVAVTRTVTGGVRL